MQHRPLSSDLEEILLKNSDPAGATLNSLMLHTEGRGVYLVMVLLCLPTLTPVPLPVINNILGVVLFLMALSLAAGRVPRLPKFIGDRRLTPSQWEKVLKASVKVVRFLEKFIRPRKTQWLGWRAARIINATIMALLAILLALPTPPGILFVNSLPSIAILIIALAQMEEDGLVIWIGYGVAAGAVVYFIFLFKVMIIAAKASGAWLAQFWHNLF